MGRKITRIEELCGGKTFKMKRIPLLTLSMGGWQQTPRSVPDNAIRIRSGSQSPLPESCGSTLFFNRTHLCGLFHRVIFSGFSRMDRCRGSGISSI